MLPRPPIQGTRPLRRLFLHVSGMYAPQQVGWDRALDRTRGQPTAVESRQSRRILLVNALRAPQLQTIRVPVPCDAMRTGRRPSRLRRTGSTATWGNHSEVAVDSPRHGGRPQARCRHHWPTGRTRRRTGSSVSACGRPTSTQSKAASEREPRPVVRTRRRAAGMYHQRSLFARTRQPGLLPYQRSHLSVSPPGNARPRGQPSWCTSWKEWQICPRRSVF